MTAHNRASKQIASRMPTSSGHVDKWCRDKPKLVALAAKLAVPDSGRLASFLARAQHRRATELAGAAPPLDEWRRCYRDPMYLVGDLLKTTVGQEKALSYGLFAAQHLGALVVSDGHRPPTPEEAGAIVQMISQIMDDVDARIIDNPDVSAIQRPTSVIFVARVFMPCITIYQKTPSTLYEQAVSGDLDAIEDLLRLDKSSLTDPAIAEIWHRHMSSGNFAIRKRISKAAGTDTALGPTHRDFDISIAAMLQIFCEWLEYPLSAAQIRRLFDAAARDSSKWLYNENLPATDGALAQALLRERKRLPFESMLTTQK